MSEPSKHSLTTSNEQPPWNKQPSPFPSQTVQGDPKQVKPNCITTLRCPVCGYGYNRPMSVEVHGMFAGTGTRIDAAGTKVFHAPPRRGITVDLEFYGECGHAFLVTYEFQQGQTLMTLREKPKHPCRDAWDQPERM